MRVASYKFLKLIWLISFAFVFLGKTGVAESIQNGNEFALCYSTNSVDRQKEIERTVIRRIYTFRYLRVIEIELDKPVNGAITVITEEPSSSMQVGLILMKPLSLKRAANLSTGECVAAKGRIKSIGSKVTNSASNAPCFMSLQPAILLYKDRCGPKLSKELLREIDTRAH